MWTGGGPALVAVLTGPSSLRSQRVECLDETREERCYLTYLLLYPVPLSCGDGVFGVWGSCSTQMDLVYPRPETAGVRGDGNEV